MLSINGGILGGNFIFFLITIRFISKYYLSRVHPPLLLLGILSWLISDYVAVGRLLKFIL